MGQDCVCGYGQEELYCQNGAPDCFRGSIIPEWKKEQIRCSVYPLCCSSLLQRQCHPITKGGADKLCSTSYRWLLNDPEAECTKLARAQAGSSQKAQAGMAQLGLETKPKSELGSAEAPKYFKFSCSAGLGLGKSEIYKLSLSRAQKK